MRKFYLVFLMLFVFICFSQSIVKAGQWNPATHQYIPGYGEVVLYDSYDCREQSGKPFVLLKVSVNNGNYPDFTRMDATGGGNWNDRTSCLYVGPNTKIVGYQHINYGGQSKAWLQGVSSLRGTWWDKTISSCKITTTGPPPPPPAPSVNIKATDKNGTSSDGPVQIYIHTASTLSWTSTNATSCTASGDWMGSKQTSGSESTGNLASSKTYTLTCSGSGGSASDSVTVNVTSTGGVGGGGAGGAVPKYK
jgi:hypothetical protein